MAKLTFNETILDDTILTETSYDSIGMYIMIGINFLCACIGTAMCSLKRTYAQEASLRELAKNERYSNSIDIVREYMKLEPKTIIEDFNTLIMGELAEIDNLESQISSAHHEL